MDSLLIIGAGGHGKSIAEAVLLANSYRIAGFLDDDYNAKKKGFGLSCIRANL